MNDDHLFESQRLLHGLEHRSIPKGRPIWPWLLHLPLLLISGSLFITALHTSNTGCTEHRSPFLGKYDSTAKVRFDGSFNRSSSFKGPPSRSVDEAWDRIVPLAVIKVPEREFSKINASKYAVEVPQKAGGGRMAIFEAVHQIHCVRMLWQTAYPEYYIQHYRESQENREEWLEHIDHCADMLRQKLMCDADPALVTYNWLKNHRVPHPNFNVQHQCRDYDQLLREVENLMLDGRLLDEGKVLRPADKDVVEFEGEPPFDPDAEP